MTILTTKRLRLEPYTEAHTDGLHILNSNIEVMRYITGRPLLLEETVDHIQQVKELWNHYGFSSWSIIEVNTNQVIGSCGAQHLEFDSVNPIEVGWRLIPSKWGQGFAAEAGQAILDFLFSRFNIKLVYAVCHQDNNNSVRVMEQLGMHYRGIERWYDLDTKVFTMSRLDHTLLHLTHTLTASQLYTAPQTQESSAEATF